ncbi:conserved exported hypothetical protein [Candidatus Terasakiella magnetica]|uniref:Uncharacterized protein n=1 Tax=Candidatus Terasakiella magnetica TaxID=1867952 RepID=A0A1C3RLU9_9PROT|nr:hypothetical protein [Candidatus Terasakiella magnetica]SCA58264.1 conserved exported hypothetical protein [Candidatus Terasakiella magnetica]
MSELPLLIHRPSPKRLALTLGAVFIGGAVLIGSTTMALSAPNWTPQSSERLVKLPPSYLKKSIDHDFANSELGSAISEKEENISLKGSTLGDLQKAIETADGDVRGELRHQFLAEKRNYLSMMSERNDLRRKHLLTKRRLFDDMLQRLSQEEGAMSPEKEELLELQNAAAERFDSSLVKVDQRLFEAPELEESKYSKAYQQNKTAIEQLVARIDNHQMTQRPMSDNGVVLSREEHVRRMVADVQTDLAVLDQEETILGYMAKLVALDAMSLAEEGLDEELLDSDVVGNTLAPAKNVSFFLNN